MAIIAGIDFGKRIGLAFSSEEETMALPSCTCHSIPELAQKIIARKATKLVVGWPLLLSGKEGEQCETTRKMLEKLLPLVNNLPYHLQDERFSSKFSKFLSNSIDDMHSAAWILQAFLDSGKHI